MQIFDEGALVPLHPTIEAIVRAVIEISPALVKMQQGLALLHFSEMGAHLSAFRKNHAAEVRKKVQHRGHARE